MSGIETYVIDLSDWAATRKLLQGIGAIDLLVNNAGVYIRAPFLDVKKEDLDK